VATHESITARAERGAERILRLAEEGNHSEARRLMNLPDWGIEEEGTERTALSLEKQSSTEERYI